jgi:hypothetical protein
MCSTTPASYFFREKKAFAEIKKTRNVSNGNQRNSCPKIEAIFYATARRSLMAIIPRFQPRGSIQFRKFRISLNAVKRWQGKEPPLATSGQQISSNFRRIFIALTSHHFSTIKKFDEFFVEFFFIKFSSN